MMTAAIRGMSRGIFTAAAAPFRFAFVIVGAVSPNAIPAVGEEEQRLQLAPTETGMGRGTYKIHLSTC